MTSGLNHRSWHSPSNAHAYRLYVVKELAFRRICLPFGSQEQKARMSGPFELDISLTMSYFHTGIRTIIGAEAFHCPVRDGKEWDHLAMVIKLNRYFCLPKIENRINSKSRDQSMTEPLRRNLPPFQGVKIIGSSLTSN